MMHNLPDLFIWYFAFVFSTTCHEAAHAFVAYRGGDLTAYSGGHVTLDPVPHIRRSPFGMVVVPLVTYFFYGSMIGWASVPVNSRWARAHPRRSALMALAGPLTNLTLAALALLIMRQLLSSHVLREPLGSISIAEYVVPPYSAGQHSLLGALARFLSIMAGLNVELGLFNLIPFPPLDGAVVLEGSAPRLGGAFYDRLREVPMFQILGLLASWRLFDYVAGPALAWVVTQLYG